MVTPLLLTLANIIEAAWFTFEPYLIASWLNWFLAVPYQLVHDPLRYNLASNW